MFRSTSRNNKQLEQRERHGGVSRSNDGPARRNHVAQHASASASQGRRSSQKGASCRPDALCAVASVAPRERYCCGQEKSNSETTDQGKYPTSAANEPRKGIEQESNRNAREILVGTRRSKQEQGRNDRKRAECRTTQASASSRIALCAHVSVQHCASSSTHTR